MSDCTWAGGDEPCPTCPRVVSALHRCGILQDVASRQDPEPFRLRMRVINHIEERLSKAKHKKDKAIFLSDEAWALVLRSLKSA